ncbi:MAG: homocysteine S-methyltransferase family protein [Lachnospiraceae bacterium]|jgi:5-methyltetrahydrofolate--homocysteine methyltransferase|nr:homocysteine S-methyltransferase family protein [Lachnospiraceae bacterium]MDD3614838.1 homocysteine S-methyltransferase family protein [Lachnospiraceae bacterium]
MKKSEFRELVKKPVLLDGATGSNLTLAGMPKGVCTEMWVLEHADILVELQKQYIAAGSQIVYAPTFAANRISLKAFGLEDEVASINTRLVGLSKEAARGSDALIAGDVTTTGKFLEPYGDLTYEELLEAYKEQIKVLADAGVDLLVAETMLGADEVCIFLDAAKAVCDLPLMCSLTVSADGRTLYGGDMMEAVTTLQQFGADAVGINCSVGPDQLEATVRSMAKVATIPIIAKPNAGLPTITDTGEAVYSMDAAAFAKSCRALVDAGAGIIGGCCGTKPEYIKALKEMLK